MYSILLENNEEKHTSKGIPKRIKQKHSEYKNVLFSGHGTSVKFNSIVTKNHKINSECINKVCLSVFDDTCRLENNVKTKY